MASDMQYNYMNEAIVVVKCLVKSCLMKYKPQKWEVDSDIKLS